MNFNMAHLSGGIIIDLLNALFICLLCRKVDTFQGIVACGQLSSDGTPISGLLRA